MSTLFRWIGGVGLDWDAVSGTITNWLNISDGTMTVVPTSDTGDVAVFDDGGLHTISGGGSADQFSITQETTVTLTGDRYEAGAFIEGDNAPFPDDLVVDDGSKLIVASGAGLQNQGTVDVIGLGADLFGGSGNGSLEVDQGGIYETEALIIGDGTAGNGVVTIDNALIFTVIGPAGVGSGDGELTIGQMGTGSLSVTGTPNVFTEGAVLGLNQGAVGSMSLDHSSWEGGDVTVGAAGVGHMTLGAGATTALHNFVVGSAEGASGDLTVTGANGFFTDFLTIGAAGTGTATFEAGSTGTFTAVTVGESAGAIANLTLDGATWNAADLTIGLTGTGHATAAAGEVITVNDAVLGSGADASGDLGLDNASLNGGTLTVGLDGTGEVTISDGSTGTMTSAVLGADQDSSGTLTIDDADWSVGDLTVGLAGTGLAMIQDGATANVGTVVIGPSGSLVATQAAGSAGTLIAAQVTLDFGVLDVSQGGQVLIGATNGDNGVVAVGAGSSLTGLGSLKGDVVLSNGGIVQATAPVPGALTIDGNVSGAGTIQPLMTMEVNGLIDSGVAIAFSPSIAAQVGDLVLDVPGGEQGTIMGFSAGNTIDLKGVDYTDAVFTQGTSGAAGTLTLSGGPSSPLSLLFIGDYAADAFTATPEISSAAGVRAAASVPGAVTVSSFAGAPGTDTVVTVVTCFLHGTWIATERGDVAVEDLRVGDSVLTADGRIEPIHWIGTRTIDCARHPNPDVVWPVRVAAGAFGEHVPRRDLYLSPDHAVFADGVLVPVKLLINGGSIARRKRTIVTYYHVELARHEVILAEGLAVESYLDVGDRSDFRGGDKMIRLFPDFATRLAPDTTQAWETRGAAPLAMTGEALAKVRGLVGRHVSREAFRSGAG